MTCRICSEGGGAPAVSDVAPLDTPPVVSAFAIACRSPKGVLYEDDKVRVGWMESQPYADRIGGAGFFFQNKLGGALTNFSVSIGQASSLSVKLQDMDPTIPAGASGKMGVQVRLEDAYSDPPVATISFATDRPTQMALRIPIVVTKFSKGHTIADPAQFPGFWGQAAATECQANLTTSRALERGSLEGMLSALNCSPMAKIDPNPANIVAGARASTAAGEVWCLIRLQCAPNKTQFILSARGSNKEYAKGVFNVIVAQLKSV